MDLNDTPEQAAYRQKAQAAHPDKGGDHDAMTRLNIARAEALKSVG